MLHSLLLVVIVLVHSRKMRIVIMMTTLMEEEITLLWTHMMLVQVMMIPALVAEEAEVAAGEVLFPSKNFILPNLIDPLGLKIGQKMLMPSTWRMTYHLHLDPALAIW
jgi:hypothetical protein